MNSLALASCSRASGASSDFGILVEEVLEVGHPLLLVGHHVPALVVLGGELGEDLAEGGVRAELGPLLAVDQLVEQRQARGIEAGLVGRRQAVDDLLVVDQLVFGGLGGLDHGAEQRDPADVELGHVLLRLGDWRCASS